MKKQLVAVSLLCLAAPALTAAEASWKDELVTPVANPILFESPVIQSELRPLFFYHNLNDKFLIPGDVQVYALQFRLALTEKLALIATKDGWVELNPKAGGNVDGWADIGAGLKYNLIDDADNQFLLTPGFTFTFPTGDDEVFQGSDHGDGQFDFFVSAAKGFDKFQLMGNAGLILPIDSDKDSTLLHYSIQLAHNSCSWFKPFVVLNGYTGLRNGKTPGLGGLTSEGYDVINFGAGDVKGETMLVLGAGFRTALGRAVDLGFAYEKDITTDDGIFDDRFTVDLIWKF